MERIWVGYRPAVANPVTGKLTTTKYFITRIMQALSALLKLNRNTLQWITIFSLEVSNMLLLNI